MFSKVTLSILLLTAGLAICKGQNFNYTLSHSNSQYTELADSESVVINDLWSNNQTIPVGFNINIAGSVFESFRLFSNGVLSFDRDQKINFVSLFKNFYEERNQEGVIVSSILTQSIIEGNHKIFKIEFKNVAFSDVNSNKVNVSFQIWLKENNEIEFHMGMVSLITNEPCIIGLLNMNANQDSSLGYLMVGDPNSPSAGIISYGQAPSKITNIPQKGSIYTYIPVTN
jgi:hypothetical protein